MVYIFEGGGKGKTSAALGVAVRTLSIGKKVVWISWFKSLQWSISESRLPEYFGKKLMMYWVGEGFYIRTGKTKKLAGGAVARDHATLALHLKAAKRGLSLAKRVLERKNPPSLLVLDELIQAVGEKLLTEEEVLNVIRKRGKVHLVITGHSCPSLIKDEADLVTEMRKKKHPYDRGRLAVAGLDF